MLKAFFSSLILSLAIAPPAFAQFLEGRDYDVIVPALRTGSADKIEVVEFFAYNCGHCYNFEPLIEQWRLGLADDVVFLGSPAVWSASMEPHAKAFYAARALGVLEQVHSALFAAMHVDRKRLGSAAEIRQVFVANGVDGADFDRAFNSFGVSSQVRQAMARARGTRITGTPELMVAGKYRVTTGKAGSQTNMLKIADFLIARERAARRALASE